MRSIEKDIEFPQLEKRILERWKAGNTFRRSIEQRAGAREYVFFDGPPFANNLPHYGHLLAGIIKDIVPRYWTMRGFRVHRRFGWDTHGLPVEMEVEKDLGIVGKGVAEVGIHKFNEACRASVLKYAKEWESTVEKTGRWVDFEDRYLTMQPSFMESVWWVFRQLWDKGLIYEGHRVLPYSTGCHTPLSNFEASADYRDVQDPAITVTMPWIDDPDTAFLVWTTTPWTLPANLAVAVHPEIDYVKLQDHTDGRRWVLAEGLVAQYFKKPEEYTILARMKGRELAGIGYTPLFDFFEGKRAEGAFRVLVDEYVTAEDGAGIVHLAPAYGEDDFRVCLREGITLADPIDLDGRFTEPVTIWKGLYIKDADPLIIAELKKQKRLVRHVTLVHSYPYCERSGFPLMYKAMPVWFVKVTELRDRMLAANAKTSWIPENLRDGRFGKWLEGARDWNISRNRYWGTPIPIWRCDACRDLNVIGSIAELEQLSGEKVEDLHMHMIDHLGWTCPKCGAGRMKRIPEVLDCWFESGAMPYAQNHYPFENREHVENGLPADFIAEGLDQTRGWFYTLMVLSTALFDRPAFSNVIVNGLILAEDGKKMSKRLRNYPPPDAILDAHGADALRLYLINSGAVRAEDLRFSERSVRDVVRLALLPLWNAYNFFVTYALIDGFDPAAPRPDQSDDILDQWIRSRVSTLTRTVREEMDAYRLYRVVPELIRFIDDLTNWYIRLNRRRFWKPGLEGDKAKAYGTLYDVLVNFSLLLAPFTPFLAEEIWGNLTGAEDAATQSTADSVHLQDFPEGSGSMDPGLENTFFLMQEAILLGRSLREEQKIGVRQPLPEMTVIHPEASLSERFSPLVGVIRDELNVKEIRFATNEADYVHLDAKPNLKVLGPRLGKKMKAVAAAIGALSQDQLRAVQAGGTLVIEDETLDADCFLITRTALPGQVVTAGTGLSVALNTTITPELRAEGLAREMINRIQRLRKDSGFEVQDRIAVRWHTDDAELEGALAVHGATVAGEVLAVSWEATGRMAAEECRDFDLDGRFVQVFVQKI
ncbi:isoleucine--tRNA ligase [Myxococcota bacterium]|nr:isoleucine--tRNA ligase [Myxococcota bacterium]